MKSQTAPAFCRYYSEFGEDRWIAENLNLPERGYFIDVGCAGPGQGSNVQHFIDRGWSGLAIEANPGYAETWAALDNDNVQFIAGIVSHRPIVNFEFRDPPGHSRIGGKVNFAATTLDYLRLQTGWRPIDLLSIDTEGSEWEVFTSLKKGPMPKIVIAEFKTADPPGPPIEDFRLRDLLLWHIGYREVYRTEASIIFEYPGR